MTPHDPFAITAPDPDRRFEGARSLDKRSWTLWLTIVWTAVAVTLVLGAVLLLVGAPVPNWPWEETPKFLIAGLGLAVLSLALHLTRQQHRVTRLRSELRSAEQEVDRKLARNYARMVAILNVGRALGTANDPQAVFDVITQNCFETFPCDRVSLMLLDRDTGNLVVRSATGSEDLERVIGATLAPGQGVAGWVAENREPVVLGGSVDPSEYSGFSPKDVPPQAAMVVPIELRDEVLGVINVSSRSRVVYDDEDVQALTVFAEYTGICCRHAEQAQWMRETIRRLDSELSRQEGPGRAAA
jgi:transcriptional regulator with GAF, ATPase, and Fis domain